MYCWWKSFYFEQVLKCSCYSYLSTKRMIQLLHSGPSFPLIVSSMYIKLSSCFLPKFGENIFLLVFLWLLLLWHWTSQLSLRKKLVDWFTWSYNYFPLLRIFLLFFHFIFYSYIVKPPVGTTLYGLNPFRTLWFLFRSPDNTLFFFFQLSKEDVYNKVKWRQWKAAILRLLPPALGPRPPLLHCLWCPDL